MASDARHGSNERLISPITAQTVTHISPVKPEAYDWVRLVFLRSGTGIVCSEFGEKPVRPGDVLALGANVLSGCQPEDPVTSTTVFLDRDYLADQVFWQHSAVLIDRLEAHELLGERYVEPAQVLRLSDEDFSYVLSQLDQLVDVTACKDASSVFFCAEELTLSILQVILPYLEVSTARRSSTQRHATQLTVLRRRALRPLRPEARKSGTADGLVDSGVYAARATALW